MEKKSGRGTRSRKAKTREEKTVQVETLQECGSSDKNVRDEKMAAGNVGAKEETKKAYSGRRGRKPKVKIVIQPEASPSGLSTPQNTTLVEKTDFMVICKYKLPPQFSLKPTRPYEVRWGQNFLKTLKPNPKRTSILKKSHVGGKGKPRLRFSETTVYYFERAQPHSTIPTEGDIAVNMERHHFYSNLLPVDAYEAQKGTRQKRTLTAMNHIDNEQEIHKLILPPTSDEKTIILHTIQVPVELVDEEDNKKNIIIPKVKKSCSCNLYCDPDICECNLTGKKCEVFKDDFPCGCKLEYCKNANGREAYNDKYIQKNIVTVSNSRNSASTTDAVKSDRVNRRKQLAPLPYKKH